MDSKTPHRERARAGGHGRSAHRDPRLETVRLGWKPQRGRDLYHWFQTLPLAAVALIGALAYLVISFGFALVYLADPEGIANARPGSLTDAFFFSVQTLGTIGYGQMFPKSVYANVVVTAETVTALLTFALITGLLFTRFSRASARVLFSDVAVVTPYEGVPTLMFRMANERRNQILQAEVRVTLLRTEYTREGVEIRRQHDLRLVRNQSSFFGQSWTVMHRLDKESPLHGQERPALMDCDTEIAVLLAGIDETLGQTIHARHTYFPERILWQRRFVDILTRDESGRRVVDLLHFHDTKALEEDSDPA